MNQHHPHINLIFQMLQMRLGVAYCSLRPFAYNCILSSLIVFCLSGCYFTRNVNQKNEDMNRIEHELPKQVYQVQYHAVDNQIDTLIIVDAFGNGASLQIKKMNSDVKWEWEWVWEITSTTQLHSDFASARLIASAGEYENRVNIDWLNGGDRTGIGSDGKVYAFELNGGFSHTEGYTYRVVSRFANTDKMNVAFKEMPWINRSKKDLYINRLNYIWSVPLDIIVSPFLLIAIPFVPNYGAFN